MSLILTIQTLLEWLGNYVHRYEGFHTMLFSRELLYTFGKPFSSSDIAQNQNICGGEWLSQHNHAYLGHTYTPVPGHCLSPEHMW